MTADPPPQPYVDVESLEIIKRVLAKEVLRQAFQALNLFGGADRRTAFMANSETQHNGVSQLPPAQAGGPPGPTIEQLVSAWIQSNQAAISHMADVLLGLHTPESGCGAPDPDRFC